jgi:phosphate transport system permease protein
MTLDAEPGYQERLQKRHRWSARFALLCRISTWSAMVILLVLLLSVAARINHEGAISAYVDGDVTPAGLDAAEQLFQQHPRITAVERDVDKSGLVSFFLTVGDRTTDDGELIRYEDIRYDLEEDSYDLEGISLTFDSSEPVKGWDWGFLTNYPSTLYPEKAGILAGIWGSIWLVLLTGLIAVPLGVGAAIYLEEYASDTWMTRLIKLNLANLAGVPSIVYGILGFAVFVRFFGKKLMLGQFQLLPLGPTVLTGALTLALLILPVIIVATQEALKSIPGSIRSASFALGATKWQTIQYQILPASLPGIATGVILALSRALGETAPIVVIGVLAFTRSTPGDIETPVDLVTHPGQLMQVPFDKFATLPIQIYNWVADSRPEFGAQAARGILVLLLVLLCINSIAIYIRNRYAKNLNW